jgi:hypothetical protein
MKKFAFGKQLRWLLIALAFTGLAIFLKDLTTGFQWFDEFSGYGK